MCCCQFVNAFSVNASLRWAFQVKKKIMRKKKKKREKFISGTKEMVHCYLKVGIPCASELSKCIGI